MFFAVGADLLAALNNPRTAGDLECFGKMICVKPRSVSQFAAVGFNVRCLRLTKLFLLSPPGPEARSLAAAVVRQVFLLDETFDLLCPSAAVGFSITSVASFRLNQSFLVSSWVWSLAAVDFTVFRRVFLLD